MIIAKILFVLNVVVLSCTENEWLLPTNGKIVKPTKNDKRRIEKKMIGKSVPTFSEQVSNYLKIRKNTTKTWRRFLAFVATF